MDGLPFYLPFYLTSYLTSYLASYLTYLQRTPIERTIN